MYIATRAIVLSQFKYGDTSIITRIFTEEAGVQSFLLKGLRSNKSKTKAAFFLPLSLIEIQVPKQSKANLQILKDPRFLYHYEDIYKNIEKQSIFLFLSEILNKSLQTATAEKELFDFVFKAMMALDQTKEKCNDFHLLFLSKLASHLGFHLEQTAIDEFKYFDLVNGCFLPDCPSHSNYLKGESCLLFNELIHCSFSESNYNYFVGRNRNLLLDSLLEYYKIHILESVNIHSHDVLKDILH